MRSWPARTAVLVASLLVAARAGAANPPGAATTSPAAGAAPVPSAPAAAEPAPRPIAAPTVLVAPAAGEPPRAGLMRDPAPRPAPALRVQARYAQKLHQALLFGGVEYLSRGDYFISPGARVGLAYYVLEPLALEVQVSHYWSSLNGEAERIKTNFGLIPDSHAPEWLALAGVRYSIGYGKLMVGGLGKAIHFEPQAFLHAGAHVNDGDAGFSSDAGVGLLVFLTPRFFGRIDMALLFDREDRSGKAVSVWGGLPSLTLGGML
jgi:hypothetical protein